MSELLPSDGENHETESVALFDELTASPGWSSFCEAVVELENSIVLYERDELDDRMQTLREEVIELGGLIGYEYHGEPCHVVGLAYGERAEGDEFPEPIVLSTNQATFFGCDLQYISGRWRVLLEVEAVPSEIGDELLMSDGQASESPAKMYYILPDQQNLMSLHISPGEDTADETDDMSEGVQVVEYLHNMADDAAARIAEPDFSNLPFKAQQDLLGEYLVDLDANFPRELRNRQILIDCTGYYTGYADMPGMTFKDYTDWSDEAWQGAEQRLLMGEVVGFSYLEFEDIPTNRPLTPASFVHGGVPYVDLCTDDPSVMYHVPLSIIRSIM